MTEASKTETSKRTKLTEQQLDALVQAAFSDGQMPEAAKRHTLANELGLTRPRCVHRRVVPEQASTLARDDGAQCKLPSHR